MSLDTPSEPASEPGGTVSSVVFDPSGLLPGDVVLERSGGKESDLITRVDGGNYSHVLIHLGSGEFMEAIDGGSRSISFLRLPIDKPDRWSLLRYVGAGKMSRLVAEQAALEARNLAHMPYNLWGALTSVTPLGGQPTTALFCSELVAEAFRRAGGEIEHGLPPEKITPRVVERSKRFTAMTPLPLMRGVSPAGDRGAAYATTPMHDENQLVQAVFAQLMGQYGLTIRSGVLGAEPRTLAARLALNSQVKGRRLGHNIMDAIVDLNECEEVVLQLRLERQMAARKARRHGAGNRAMARRDGSTTRFHGLILSHNLGDS